MTLKVTDQARQQQQQQMSLGFMEVKTIVETARGDHSLLYFAYTCVQDLVIGGVNYLAKNIIR
jgi:hypothetical protein